MDGAGRALAASVVPVGAVGRLRRRVDPRGLPCGARARQRPRCRAGPAAAAAGGNTEDDEHKNRRHRRPSHYGQRPMVLCLCLCGYIEGTSMLVEWRRMNAACNASIWPAGRPVLA